MIIITKLLNKIFKILLAIEKHEITSLDGIALIKFALLNKKKTK